MLLRIAPSRLISDIQSEFNGIFPFLKLEFFQNRSTGNNGEPVKIAHHRCIADCHPTAEGEIEIQKEMKVKDLEQGFKTRFGLNVQVFRRSGSLWLQTTMTDSWPLEKQNEHGKELSLTPKNSPLNAAEDNSAS